MRSLAAHGIRPDTDLGQHFLLDENLVNLAIREAAVGPRDVVLEVGAGLGVLTAPLARAAAWVHAVELDRRLEPALADALGGASNVTVHWGDAMRMPLGSLSPAPTALVANLPYSIATPLVLESLWGLPTLERWCVMVQREVVNRWLAAPGGRLYGAPSVLLQLSAAATFRRTVGREVFTPRPRVELGAGRAAPHGPGAGARRPRPGAGGLRGAAQDAGQRARARGRRPGPRRRGPGTARPPRRDPPRGPAPRGVPRPRRGPRVDRLTLRAPAKLNLRLAVGPRGADGYHPLSTLMVALDGLGDDVEVALADRRSVSCPGIEGPANLAWRALDALEAAVGRSLPVAVRIHKRIPAQAGLGGGSSDAAATLVAADRLHGLALGADALEAIAARAGSDVPFFVRGGAQWAGGRGERLRPAAVPGFAALLAKPDAGLSTAAVYAAFDRLPPPGPAGDATAPASADELAGWVRNDLWPAALALAPRLGATARSLRAAGARAVLLCGSGSCLAGLYRDRGAAEAGLARLPGAGFRAVVEPVPR